MLTMDVTYGNVTTTYSNLYETLYFELNYYGETYWKIGADPRTSQFPLVKEGPWLVITILAAYLLIVKYFGPWMMKDRPSFDLKLLILAYNIVMMIANAVFFCYAAVYTRFGFDCWSCEPVDPNKVDPLFMWKLELMWYFFISKFIDLCETIFFILRKKFNQASALHIFHHTMVPLNVWVGLKYAPTTSASFFPFINSLVHTLMYLYYGLSTLGPAVRPYLWWKKYLTQLQIFQLALISIHCLHLCLIPNCGIPKIIFALYLPQALLLVYQFVSFFVNTYLARIKKTD